MADSATESTAPASTSQERNSPSSSVCYLAESTLEEPGEPLDIHVAKEGQDEPTDIWEGATPDDDGGSTPRSEMPSVAETPITGTAPGDTAELSADYFAPKPVRAPSTLLNISSEDSTEALSYHNAGHPPLELKISHSSSPTPAEPSSITAYFGRPQPQRDLSSASTASTTSTNTIRASEFLSQVPTYRPPREYPPFPNQAYSALSAQHHPQPYVPRHLKTRSSNPSPYLSYTAHAELTGSGHPGDPRAAAESGSKTAGNSPASSPGLFTPTTSPHRADFADAEAHGGYSSPYLHFTHRQMPKETHLADIDRDPISGRKVVNQYEFIDELGRGVHGKVKLGRDLETGQYVAIKIVERNSKRPRLGKSGNHEEKIKREIAILKKARHPNIVGLLEVIDDPDVKKVYIVLEHVEMGEIKWRTEGAREICLVEWRRYNREAHGRLDDEAAELEDERILEEARRFRLKADRRKWRQLHRQQADDPGNNESWSLEHGNDAEEDDIYENASRASTLTDEASHTPSQPDIHQPGPHDHADAVYETSIHDDQRQERLHFLGHETSDQHPSPQHSEKGLDDQFETGLEGTMYGAYDFDSPRGRTPSIIGSAESLRHLGEEEDEIPEHFRHVPLMTLTATRAAFRDTILGLEFLHYQGVVHRDIKPANLLQAADHHIKISDFGVSYLGRERKVPRADGDASESEAPDPDDALELAKTVGTPAFYAPELCLTDPDEDAPPVTSQIDLWALGVTLYCLVYGRVPFHDNNTFVLMRRIAEEKVYIPRHRLKAVDEHASSRPSSHGRHYKPMNSNKRLPHDLEVEEVDDELYDLLSRLLEKDPRKRIKLVEVKRHPWVLKDLGVDPVKWLDETDPSSQMQGQRIAISKEDVDVAVVPINLFDRIRDTVRKVTNSLGINRSSSKVKRDRGKSNAGHRENQPSSAGSSSSTISQDARRQQEARRPSLKPDESIYSALRSSREPEHPLSQSVTASPEAREHPQFFSGSSFLPHSPESASQPVQPTSEASASQRPPGLDRTISAAESMRTIRPMDALSISTSGASTLPAFPSTPLVIDTISNSAGGLGNIIGHTAKNMMRSLGRSRERKGTHSDRDTSVESRRTDDMYADPSIGLSNTIASGHVNPPSLPTESSMGGSSGLPSPVSSRAQSLASASHDRLQNAATRSDDSGLSRQSSVASISSRPRSSTLAVPSGNGHPPQANYLPLTDDVIDGRYSKPNPITGSTTDMRFLKAQDELIRRRKLEEEQNKDGLSSSPSQQRPPSSLSQEACPPSPDDEIFVQNQQQEAHQKLHPVICTLKALPEAEPATFNAEQLERHNQFERHNIVSSSSEDHFTSGMSQSTSNPSIPSVVSADSSVPPDDGVYMLSPDKLPEERVGTTKKPFGLHQHEDYEGYDGDGDAAAESDSDDSFIEMSRQKSKQPPKHSESASNGELALHGYKKSPSSARSARSGSNNTMMKVQTQGESDEEGRGRSLSSD